MKKKKYLLFLIYLGVVWLVGIFIFGKAGILDNMYQSKEILRLTEAIWKSNIEIEEMTREYYKLAHMKIPNQAFLIEQGRKTQNIIVFKMKEHFQTPMKQKISLDAEKDLFVFGGFIAFCILLVGCIAIFIIAYISKYKKDKMLKKDVEC